jgi:hypothetical protein
MEPQQTTLNTIKKLSPSSNQQNKLKLWVVSYFVLKILGVLFLGLYMRRICKILADCKTKLSGVFSKLWCKIKTVFKPSASTIVVFKQKSEEN